LAKCKLKLIEIRVESAWFQRVETKLQYDELLSSFASNQGLTLVQIQLTLTRLRH